MKYLFKVVYRVMGPNEESDDRTEYWLCKSFNAVIDRLSRNKSVIIRSVECLCVEHNILKYDSRSSSESRWILVKDNKQYIHPDWHLETLCGIGTENWKDFAREIAEEVERIRVERDKLEQRWVIFYNGSVAGPRLFHGETKKNQFPIELDDVPFQKMFHDKEYAITVAKKLKAYILEMGDNYNRPVLGVKREKK